MKLIDGWQTVATQAWSVKLNYAGAVASLMEMLNVLSQFLPIIQPLLPPGWFAGVALLCIIGSVVARFVPQPQMHDAIAQKKGADSEAP